MVEKIGKTYWDVASLSQIKSDKEAIKEFEAYFVRIFLKEARKSIPEGLFNTSFSSKFYFDMLDMQLSEIFAQQDPLGFERFFEKALESYQKVKKG